MLQPAGVAAAVFTRHSDRRNKTPADALWVAVQVRNWGKANRDDIKLKQETARENQGTQIAAGLQQLYPGEGIIAVAGGVTGDYVTNDCHCHSSTPGYSSTGLPRNACFFKNKNKNIYKCSNTKHSITLKKDCYNSVYKGLSSNKTWK